jgi:hypothetical protein
VLNAIAVVPRIHGARNAVESTSWRSAAVFTLNGSRVK